MDNVLRPTVFGTKQPGHSAPLPRLPGCSALWSWFIIIERAGKQHKVIGTDMRPRYGLLRPKATQQAESELINAQDAREARLLGFTGG